MFSANAKVILGVALLLIGMAETFWFARARGPKYLVAQGLLFGEMGLMALTLGLVRDESAKLIVLSLLAIAALVSLGTLFRLLYEERHAQAKQFR